MLIEQMFQIIFKTNLCHKNDFIDSFIYCFIQTLTGDITDNVHGLHGFGKVKANKLKELLINELNILQEHTEEEKQDCQNLLFAVVFNIFNRFKEELFSLRI